MKRLVLLTASLLVAGFLAGGAVAQQPSNGPPNALQGFSQNRDKPVKIESSTLEVRDKDKMATFAGNVHLVQGDTVLRCKKLVVFYEQDQKDQKDQKSQKPNATAAPASAASQPGQNQQIKRIEARGDVIVTQNDQTATGDTGIFEMRDNKVSLTGNVMISQGPNVIRGDRLVVDMTTGVSRVECDKSQCRVSALLQPGAVRDPKETGKEPPKDAKPNAQPAAGQPPKPKPLSPSGLY